LPSNPEPSPDPVLAAKTLIDRGQNLSAGRRIQDLPEILRCFGEAIRLLEPLCAEPGNPLRDLLAVAYTHQGFALLSTRDDGALPLVLSSLDRAIALRATLLDPGEPWFRYNLVGVWINRADVLLQRGAKERLPEAIQAYDEAVRLAGDLDSAVHPAFGWRKAVARLNRAGATLRLFAPGILDQAAGDFEAALRELDPLPPPKAVAVASAWTGLSEIALRRQETETARQYADRALQVLAQEGSENFETVQTGLRARLLLGAISRKEEQEPGQNIRAAEAKAADLIEEGLGIALARPERSALMPLIIEAFAHCTRVYVVRQPKFLAEFVREFLARGAPELTSPQMLRFAIGELDAALNRLSREGLASMQPEAIEATLATVTDLRELRAELAGQLAPGVAGTGAVKA
jgi:tetratricopeptide (TPR) repeat protein